MFDPYRKWLGIQAKDLPPNHYRLLGIEAFESDQDVIEGAADRQMSFVRQYQSGEHAAAAAKILNELAIARLCLLKRATKAAYDEKLRQDLEPPEDDFQFDSAPSKAKPASKKKRSSAKQQAAGSTQLLIAGGGAAVVGLLLVMFLMSGSRKQPEKLVDAETSPPPKPTVVEPSTERPVQAAPGADYLWHDEALSAQPAGPTIDMLKTVEIPKHILQGEWQQTPTALIGPPHGRMYFPVKMPDDYQLKYSLRRIEGDDTLMVGIQMSGRQGIVILDGWHAAASGLSVDGREPNDNCTTWRRRLFGDQVADVVVTVHPGQCHLAVDGKTIFDWHGDPERLSSLFSLANREAPMLHISNSKYVIEAARLTPLKPVPPLKRLARLDHEIDLMPLVDTERDAKRGIWGLTKGALSSPEGHGRIYLPTIVPEEYTVSGTVEVPAHQTGYSLGFGLVAGDRYLQFHCNQDNAGLDITSSQRFHSSETRMEGNWFKPGVRTPVRCTVTKDRITVEVDNKTIVDWKGDLRQCEMAGDWALPDARRLLVGASTHLKFRDLKLGPPVLPAKLPNLPELSVGKSVDLLALIDPARDSLAGTWERDGKSIRTLADVMRSKLVVPIEPPTDYKLTLKVAREPGGFSNDDAFLMTLPTAGEKAIVAFDGWGKTASGCAIDGPDFYAPPISWRGTAIEDGPAQELTCIVRGTGIKVLKGEQTILDWTGSPQRFFFDSQFRTPGNKIGLISWNSRFRIEKLELEPLPPVTYPEPSSLSGNVDVLASLDLNRDVRLGKWTLTGDGLTSEKIQGARVQIPITVPECYAFTVEIERKEGTDGFKFGIPVKDRFCEICFDNYGAHHSGLMYVDKMQVNDGANLTRRQHASPIFPVGKRMKVVCRVTPDTIIATVNDVELVRWHGDARRLSRVPFNHRSKLQESDRSKIWFLTWDTIFHVHSFHMQPLTNDEAKSLDAQFDGVFPLSPQPDFVFPAVALEPSQSEAVADFPAGRTGTAPR